MHIQNSLGATWIGNNYYSKFLFQKTFSAYSGPDTDTLPLQGGTLCNTRNPLTSMTLFSGLTQFLNLHKDGRMILEVRVPPEICEMTSSPPDFIKIRTGYFC